MISKIKILIILYIDSNDCMFANTNRNIQRKTKAALKYYPTMDFVDNHRDTLQKTKKLCTRISSNQNKTASSTTMEHQNIDTSYNDMAILESYTTDHSKKFNNSSVTQKSIETVSDFKTAPALANCSTLHRMTATSDMNETLRDPISVGKGINNEQSIQNIGNQEYTSCDDNFLDKEDLNYMQTIFMMAEAIGIPSCPSENINVEAVNLQTEGSTNKHDYSSQEKIITVLVDSIDDSGHTQTTHSDYFNQTLETNVQHKNIDDNWDIELNKLGDSILTDEGRCLDSNEIPEDKQTNKNDLPEEVCEFFSLLIEDPAESCNNTEFEKNREISGAPCCDMLNNMDSGNTELDKGVQPSPSLNDCDLPTLDTTQIEEIHELTPLSEENYCNQEDDNPKIITVPATENLPCKNREVNTSLKNHNIFTTFILTEFANDNKIYKGASMKCYEFTVLRERIDGNAEKIFKEVSYSFFLENSNECHSTRNKSKKLSKEQMELQINSKLRELYFDKKICVDLFSINEKYKEGIFKFGFISPKIKNIPQISLEKYSVNCFCGENTNFKHDIYYFSNFPLFIYPLILLDAHVRSWSVKRLYHSSMFNFILIICLKKKFLDPIDVKLRIFDFEKKPKKYTRLFLLRLKTLYIPIFERNPSNEISSLNLNPSVIQTSDFRVTKKYISLGDFLKKRYGELISTIKEYKDLIPQVIDEEPLRNNIDKMLKYAESFYGNYKEILNYLNMPGNDTQEGLLLLMKMAESINSCKFHLSLRKNFSSEELELMSFCDALKTSVVNFIKQNTLHLKNP